MYNFVVTKGSFYVSDNLPKFHSKSKYQKEFRSINQALAALRVTKSKQKNFQLFKIPADLLSVHFIESHSTSSGQNRQKTVWRSAFLLIRHSKYSAMYGIVFLYTQYRLLFRRSFLLITYPRFAISFQRFYHALNSSSSQQKKNNETNLMW